MVFLFHFVVIFTYYTFFERESRKKEKENDFIKLKLRISSKRDDPNQDPFRQTFLERVGGFKTITAFTPLPPSVPYKD